MINEAVTHSIERVHSNFGQPFLKFKDLIEWIDKMVKEKKEKKRRKRKEGKEKESKEKERNEKEEQGFK